MALETLFCKVYPVTPNSITLCPLTVSTSTRILLLQHAELIGRIQISLTQVRTMEQHHYLQGVKQIRIHPQAFPQPNSYSFKLRIIQDMQDTNMRLMVHMNCSCVLMDGVIRLCPPPLL